MDSLQVRLEEEEHKMFLTSAPKPRQVLSTPPPAVGAERMTRARWDADQSERLASWKQAKEQRKLSRKAQRRECDSCNGMFPFAQKKAERGEGFLEPFRPASGRGCIGPAGSMYLCPTCLLRHVAERLAMPVCCTKCKQTLPANRFRIETRTKQPMRVPLCHECRAFKARKTNYGITRDEYHTLLQAQGGVCAICEGDPGDARGGRFYVDHCHSTGVIRGLLCVGCNYGLGQFEDDPDRMKRAADYVRNHADIPAGGRAQTLLSSVETTSRIDDFGIRSNEAHQSLRLIETDDREGVAS